MHIIVGLGNPGERYADSRHNAGWKVLDAVLQKNGLPKKVPASKYAGEISEGVLEAKEVLFLFPTTFMNKSGSSVRKVIEKKEDANNLMVVYDDVDLPIGEIKISYGRGSGGHNGVQSVIDALGTKDFARIRIGIASKSLFGNVKRPKGGRLSEHVLGEFKRKEAKVLEGVSEQVDEAIKVVLRDGVDKAMQKWN